MLRFAKRGPIMANCTIEASSKQPVTQQYDHSHTHDEEPVNEAFSMTCLDGASLHF